MSSDSGDAGGGFHAVQPSAASATGSLEKLQKRACGGEDVATRPGVEDDDWWPTAPLLPGVIESIDDFIRGVGTDDLRIVFLLGGAGNGKSFAARSLGKSIGLDAPDGDALARRIYRTE